MNRRKLLQGVAAAGLAPVTATAAQRGDACYISGSPRCGECKSAMWCEFVDGRPLTWCCATECDRYEIRYVLPMTVLARA